MKKEIKIIIGVGIVGVAVYFLYQQFGNKKSLVGLAPSTEGFKNFASAEYEYQPVINKSTRLPEFGVPIKIKKRK